MTVIEIETQEKFDEIISNKKGNKYIFVDFYATWCGPCKRISPEIEKFSDTFKNITFLKVDVGKLEDLSQQYKIKSLPTFLIFEKGNNKPLYQPIIGSDKTKIETTLKGLGTSKVYNSNDF